MRKTASIALSSDRYMEYPLHVATASVLRHLAPDWNADFYLSLQGFGEKEIDRLRRTLDLAHRPYQLHLLPEVDHRKYPGFRPMHGNLMIFNRLLMPDSIPQERFLYLDTDTVTMIDVSPVFEGDMNRRTLGAVLDGKIRQSGDSRTYIETLGLPPEDPVFNSGVLLFHAGRWRQQNLTPQLLEFCQKGYQNGDQVALNYFFHGQCYALPSEMNVVLFPQSRRQTPANGIFHFVGSPKPWDLGGNLCNRYAHIYNHALRQTTVPEFGQSRYLQKRSYARARHLGGSYYRALRGMLGRP